MLLFMPKYHGYRVLVRVFPNMFPHSPFTNYCSSLTTHHSHDSTPPLEMSNMTLVFLPPNVTGVVQPLDQDIIASFKIQYKKRKLHWVLT